MALPERAVYNEKAKDDNHKEELVMAKKKVKYHVVGGCVTCMTCMYQCPMRAISMIEDGTLVVAVNTVMPLFDKTMANVKEVKARGADVMCVVLEGMEERALAVADSCIGVPKVHPVLQPSLALIPLQVFAYYVAVYRGCDVDKPRNLAKSVTVE